jgi:YbgC/YbaW family acyl-CoA thioester hydrolase
MAYVQRLTVRFDEVDYAQVVYFPRLFGYCHRVFEEFFGREAGVSYAELVTQRRVGFPTVHAQADFRAPLRFGDICRVVMEPLKLSKRSITNRYRLFLGETDRLCADLEIVHAAINLDQFAPVDLPEDIRVALQRHLVAPTAD